MKRPAFQFYPADWRKHAALQSCSIGARGLWHELLCVMHESEPYGHLTINGAAMPDDKAARLVGVDAKEYRKLLRELEEAGVSSRTQSGILFSRRMVKDEALRDKRAACGKLGGNPGLLVRKVNQKATNADSLDKPPDKQTPTPSSSSSSSDIHPAESRHPAREATVHPNWPKNGHKFNGKGPKTVAWWLSEKATVAYGKSLGLEANPGESIDAYRERLRQHRPA